MKSIHFSYKKQNTLLNQGKTINPQTICHLDLVQETEITIYYMTADLMLVSDIKKHSHYCLLLSYIVSSYKVVEHLIDFHNNAMNTST